MIFYYARRKGKCQWCEGEIDHGDFCVKQFIEKGNSGYLLTYHYDCYVQATIENIRERAVKYIGEHDPMKKLGRPVVYSDSKEAYRTKRLIRYHKEKGHVSKTQELEMKLAALIRHL